MTPEPTTAPTLLIFNHTPTPNHLGITLDFLVEHGYRVTMTPTGVEGLARATSMLPDLILLDATMPDLDGFEVCRRLKAQPATAGIPVIFMLTDTEHKVAVFRAGGADYITKPLQADEFLARVNTHLQIRTLQQQLHTQNEEIERKIAAHTAQLTTANAALHLKSYALNQMSEAAYLIDENARFLYVNEESCRALGYQYEELIGMTVMDIDPDWTTDRWVETWNKTQIDNHFHVETNHLRKDGSIFPVEIHASRFWYLGAKYNLAVARDITERKKAEDQLRSREREFRTLAENIPDNIIRYDAKGCPTYINASTAKLIGHQANNLSLSLSPDSLITMPSGAIEDLTTRLHTTLLSGESQEFEIKLRHISEGEQTHLVRITAEFDEEKKIVGALLLGRDITHIKQTERELRLLNNALDQSFDATYLVGNDLRFRYVNEAAVRALGYTREELLSMRLFDIHPNVTPEAVSTLMQQTAMDGRFPSTVESTHRRKDGTTFPVEIGATTFPYDGEALFLTVVRDITDRKIMENALREKQGRYRAIFDNLVDVLYLLEVMPDGRFRTLEINPAGEKSSGIPSHELVGKFVEDTLTEDAARMVNQKYQRCIDAGIPTDEEITLHLPSGRRRYHSKLVPIYDPSGSIHRIVGISRDITEQKEIESKLEESLNLLRQLSARRDAVREEERKHIAREIHDELGQMLTAQRLDIATLKFQFGENHPIIAERCQRMLKIADQTLLTVRSIATSLRPAALDMGIIPALEWLVTEFRQRTGMNCQIQLNTTDLSLDEDQAIGLFRILQESLTNVTRHAESHQVIVILGSDIDAYQLTIQDDGKGFNPHDNTVRSFGLVGIYERALMLGGIAHIDSHPGHGTTVNVRIPHHRQKGA